jgi:hypothetical protein
MSSGPNCDCLSIAATPWPVHNPCLDEQSDSSEAVAQLGSVTQKSDSSCIHTSRAFMSDDSVKALDVGLHILTTGSGNTIPPSNLPKNDSCASSQSRRRCGRRNKGVLALQMWSFMGALSILPASCCPTTAVIVHYRRRRQLRLLGLSSAALPSASMVRSPSHFFKPPPLVATTVRPSRPLPPSSATF